MAVFTILYDGNNQVVGVTKGPNPSVFAPATDSYAVYSFVTSVIQRSFNSFKGLSIDSGFAVYKITSSTALTDEQKKAALDVLGSFLPGDSFQFREAQSLFAIVIPGVPKVAPVIAVFVDP